MPFKSKSQMRAFFAMEERGELPKGTARRWLKHTKNVQNLPEKKKEAMSKFQKATEALVKQGFSEEEADRVLAQLAMLQHHIDDAEIYGGTGNQNAAHLSLDDAEENIKQIANKVLPSEKAEVVEEVAESGDKEEEEAGVESKKEAESNDAFEVGLRYVFYKQGFDTRRIEALVDVARGLAIGNIKTAEDIYSVILPHVLAECSQEKGIQ